MDSFPWKWQFCVKFHEILHFLLFTTPREGAEYCDDRICLSIGPPAFRYLRNYTCSLFIKFFGGVAICTYMYILNSTGSGAESDIYDCLVIYTFCYRLYYSAFKFNSSVTSDKNCSRYAQLPLGDRWLTSHWRAADRGQNLTSWLGRLTLIIPRKTDSVRWLIDWL